MSDEMIILAEIGAAHGIKGAVRIKLFGDDPQALTAYGPLTDTVTGQPVTVTSARPSKGVYVAQIKGVNDRNMAESLRRHPLAIERSALPATDDEDEFYHTDLIGLEAKLGDGSVLGTVLAVHNFGADDLLDIKLARGKTIMIPFTRACVPEVSIKDGYLAVVPPPGLLDDKDADSPEATKPADAS